MKKIFYFSLILTFACIFESCSWRHIFAIHNNTNQTWTIEYEVLDDRGIFQQKVYLYETKKKEPVVQKFEDKQVRFELPPGYTVEIGAARNSSYSSYSQFDQFNLEIPWAPFINIKHLTLSTEGVVLKQEGKNLKNWLHKNNRTIALVKLNPLMSLPSITP